MESPKKIQKVYLVLMLFNTLATSFIWGINTLFLLDAGLTNTEAFAANAFFTAGQVLFEIPTGIVADTWGRRPSYLLGALTLGVSTLLYFMAWQTDASFLVWVITSILLGLGYTFFSGATEAWLVDALAHVKYKGSLDNVFAKGQIVGGVAMLSGSVAGGVIAQTTNLGVPYILRAIFLGITFLVAFIFMKDLGFVPDTRENLFKDVKKIFKTSVKHGLGNPPVRWVMLIAPFTTGISFYAFYAMQPYLLELYGDETAYGVAGLAAAIVGGSQIFGGFSVGYIRKIFYKRTSVFITSIIVSAIVLMGIGFISNFWIAILLLVVWGLMFSATMPVRQAYLNGLIPSKQRATVLSFDSLMGSGGGVAVQPVLGRAADVWSYSASYVLGGFIQILALPFAILARREVPSSDPIK